MTAPLSERERRMREALEESARLIGGAIRYDSGEWGPKLLARYEKLLANIRLALACPPDEPAAPEPALPDPRPTACPKCGSQLVWFPASPLAWRCINYGCGEHGTAEPALPLIQHRFQTPPDYTENQGCWYHKRCGKPEAAHAPAAKGERR